MMELIMMKRSETEGIVLELRGDLALVRPTGHTGCDSNFCCQGEGVNKVDLEVKNEIKAVVGDKVVFEAKEGNMILAAFIIFVLPFILVFLGGVLGYKISGLISLNTIVAVIAGGALLFVISMLIIKFYDKYASNNISLKPVITRKV
jgi:sigma-E factor negative regulatory protein RseC